MGWKDYRLGNHVVSDTSNWGRQIWYYVPLTLIIGCIRFLQRNRTDIDVDIWKEIYYKGFTQAIMEAEESHNLPPASWRPRKAGGIVSVQTQRLRTTGASGVRPRLNLKARKPGARMSKGRRRWVSWRKQRANSPFLWLFVLPGPQWIGWCSPALVRIIFFTHFTNSNANIFQKYSHRHTQK